MLKRFHLYVEEYEEIIKNDESEQKEMKNAYYDIIKTMRKDLGEKENIELNENNIQITQL